MRRPRIRLAPGPVRRIYVNQRAISRNHQKQTLEPVVAVDDGQGTTHHGHEIEILGPSRVKYSRDITLTGTPARVWIETAEGVDIYDK